MNTRELIVQYLQEYPLMSIATTSDRKPWVSSVYYAFDDELHLFFISRTFRRHSKEIASNEHIAASICKPHSAPFEMPCMGIQLEGTCHAIEDRVTAEIALKNYMMRFPASEKLHASVDDVLGEIDRRIYEIIPDRFVFFDEENYPTAP